MTEPNIAVTEDELHAFVDNELPAERRGDVEAWLATHSNDAARVEAWRAMADALHARYDSVADEAVPKRLEIERLVRQARKWIAGAAAGGLLGLCGRGGAAGLCRRRRRRLDGARRFGATFRVAEPDARGAGRAQALCGRDPPSRRGAGKRAHAFAAMADQALRVGRSRAGAGCHRTEAGRRQAVARPHRTRVVPDV